MPAATNSIRRIPRGIPKSPMVPSPPLSIAPRGNRSVMPMVKRAPRIMAKDQQREYGKADAGASATGFSLPGLGE